MHVFRGCFCGTRCRDVDDATTFSSLHLQSFVSCSIRPLILFKEILFFLDNQSIHFKSHALSRTFFLHENIYQFLLLTMLKFLTTALSFFRTTLLGITSELWLNWLEAYDNLIFVNKVMSINVTHRRQYFVKRAHSGKIVYANIIYLCIYTIF